MAKVEWLTSFENALAKSRETGKHVFLDFFDPG